MKHKKRWHLSDLVGVGVSRETSDACEKVGRILLRPNTSLMIVFPAFRDPVVEVIKIFSLFQVSFFLLSPMSIRHSATYRVSSNCTCMARLSCA